MNESKIEKVFNEQKLDYSEQKRFGRFWFCLIDDKDKKINPFLIKENHYRYWFTISTTAIFFLISILWNVIVGTILVFMSSFKDNYALWLTCMIIDSIMILSLMIIANFPLRVVPGNPSFDFLVLYLAKMYEYYFNEIPKIDDSFYDNAMLFKGKKIKPNNIIKIKKTNLNKDSILKKIKVIPTLILYFEYITVVIAYAHFFIVGAQPL
ncbi:MAG: hypothetical protein ACRCVI_01735 [Mycoplasmoidaceae bacterium]